MLLIPNFIGLVITIIAGFSMLFSQYWIKRDNGNYYYFAIVGSILGICGLLMFMSGILNGEPEPIRHYFFSAGMLLVVFYLVALILTALWRKDI